MTNTRGHASTERTLTARVSAQRLLLSLLTDEAVVDPDEVNRTHEVTAGLLALARFHRVSALVSESLRGHDFLMSPQTRAAFLHDWAATAAEHGRSVSDLRCLALVMNDMSVPWLVFKGPALAEGVYPQPALRHYRDIDVLVDARSLELAVMSLCESGYRLCGPGAVRAARGQPVGQLTLVTPAGRWLDLNWALFNDSWVRQRFTMLARDVLKRRRSISVGGVDVATMDACDTAVHVALHATVAGVQRLLWLKDAERCSAAGLDPVLAAQRAQLWRADKAFRLIFRRADWLLGAAAGSPQSRSGLRSAPREALARVAAVPWNRRERLTSRMITHAAGFGPVAAVRGLTTDSLGAADWHDQSSWNTVVHPNELTQFYAVVKTEDRCLAESR